MLAFFGSFLTFVADIGRALAKALPPIIAWVLLLLTAVGAVALHVTAAERITVLETQERKLENTDTLLSGQNQLVMKSVQELTEEVRGYREDIREENKALKAKLRDRRP